MSEQRRRRRPPIVNPEAMPEQNEAQIPQYSEPPRQQEQNEFQSQQAQNQGPQYYVTSAQPPYQASYQQQPQFQQQSRQSVPQPQQTAPSVERQKTSKRSKEIKLAICKLHWIKWFVKIVLSVILLAIIAACLNYFKSNPVSDASVNSNRMKATVLLCFIGLISIINIFAAIIKYKTTYLVLTESKIIGHIGFIKSRTLTTPLPKLQDIGIGNGLWGKVFRYHTITLSSSGSSGTEYVFKYMAKARKFVDAVYAQLEKINEES